MIVLVSAGCGKKFPKMPVETCPFWLYHLTVMDVKRRSQQRVLRSGNGLVGEDDADSVHG
jgi:hypothetical protein